MKFRWSIVTSSKGSPLPIAYPTFLSISRLRETCFNMLNAPDYSPHYTWLSISDTPVPVQATQPPPACHFPCWWDEASQCLGNKTTCGPQAGRGAFMVNREQSWREDSVSTVGREGPFQEGNMGMRSGRNLPPVACPRARSFLRTLASQESSHLHSRSLTGPLRDPMKGEPLLVQHF